MDACLNMKARFKQAESVGWNLSRATLIILLRGIKYKNTEPTQCFAHFDRPRRWYKVLISVCMRSEVDTLQNRPTTRNRMKETPFLDSNEHIKPFTFISVLSPLAAKVEEIVNRTSAVRQVLEVILRQLTNTRMSSSTECMTYLPRRHRLNRLGCAAICLARLES